MQITVTCNKIFILTFIIMNIYFLVSITVKLCFSFTAMLEARRLIIPMLLISTPIYQSVSKVYYVINNVYKKKKWI